MYTVYPGLQIRVQHWGDDWHILVIFLILGGGGMILKFLSGSCYAQTHAFSTHFLQIFLMTFFLLANKLFSHISCKNALMIDGNKKVVSKQPFALFPKVNSLQS